jgi:catechol 2,3-dioxygenase-like lactoylglutathione lyase family enzyme
MDMKLELIAVPVSDVDRAKRFYTESVGFALDHDHAVSEQLALADAERAARVAPGGDVRVELRRARGEALRIGVVDRHAAVADEQRTGLDEVAAGIGAELPARGDAHRAADVHASAGEVPRRGNRLVRDGHAADAHVPERTQRMADALEAICSSRDDYGFASGGVYCFWALDTRRPLYIGRAVDLPDRFRQHNGLGGRRMIGTKLAQLKGWVDDLSRSTPMSSTRLPRLRPWRFARIGLRMVPCHPGTGFMGRQRLGVRR